MHSSWWSRAVGVTCWGSARLRRSLALALCCAGIIGLLAAMAVAPTAAQTIDCSSQSTDPDSPLIRDCETLLGLKDTLDPDGVLNWAGNVALGSWENVASDAAKGVTTLTPNNRGLAGSIPAALGDLSNLDILYLHDNELTGSIPKELGNLSNLTDLSLSRNRLSGRIPAQLGNLNLLRLYMRGNKLSGSIPTQLGNLSNLVHLYLSQNELSGSIPRQLGSLSNLTELYLWGNELTGSIPTELGNLSELTHLYLSSNRLSGSIPTSLGGLSSLTRLYLWGNRLSGSIPAQLGSLSNLEWLELSRNKLSGSIPAQLGSLSSLTELYLSENRLSGSIPTQLGSLSSLTSLGLSYNQLSGNIPTELGSLTNLTGLDLTGNQLSGSIPTELGSLTNLTHLYLAGNQLTGSIPTELGNLSSLTMLHLRDNELTGSIPTQLGSLSNVTVLYLQRNQLSGSIPTQLGNMNSLVWLGLSCNQLTGDVPESLATITSLSWLGLNATSVNLPLHADLLNQGMTINVSTYCSATAPENVRVRPGDKQLTVTWAAPADDGAPAGATGVTITAYDLRYREFRATDWTGEGIVWTATDGGSLTHRLRGLTNGTFYDVQLRAVNEAGNGAWSATVTGTPRRGGGGSSGGGGGGGSSKQSSSGGGSRAPSPPPSPTRSPIIGSTPSATAVELAGDLLVLQRHDQPGVEVEVGVGWIRHDGQRIIVIGFVRDGDLGQTYAVVRREGDGQVVRRWIAPDSPLVYAVPWEIVNTQYTFPVGVILAIPLDEQYPWPNMLTRRFDGGDDRILAYDAGLGQWRHVPDPATLQARGYYWCNVTAADAGFFDRITLGPPYPASDVPARADYPVCQT